MRLPILLLTLLAASTTASSTSSNTVTVLSPGNNNLRRVQQQQQQATGADGTRVLKKDELVTGSVGPADDEKPDNNKLVDKKKGEPEVDPRGPDEVMLAGDVVDIVDGVSDLLFCQFLYLFVVRFGAWIFCVRVTHHDAYLLLI